MEKGGSTYIITNKNCSVLYTGVTSDLESRVLEHRIKEYPTSFSAKYNAGILVFYENFESIEEAIKREKYIKGKSRKWKMTLISRFNPTWRDLYEDFTKD
jgi:putative endonuclease